MLAAKKGSAKASMRNTRVPNSRMAATGVRKPIIWGAKIYITTPIRAITPMPRPMVSQAKLRQRSCRPAPNVCPTSVEAASPIP